MKQSHNTGRWSRRETHIALSFIAALVLASCRLPVRAAELSPERTLEWPKSQANTARGARGAVLFAIAEDRATLATWCWKGDSLRKMPTYSFKEEVSSFALVSESECILTSWHAKDTQQYLQTHDFKTGDSRQQPLPRDWYVRLGQAEENGKCVPVWGKPYPDRDTQHPNVRIGVVDGDTGDIDWCATLASDNLTAMLPLCAQSLLLSNDGAHIGVAGWDNQVAMIDVRTKNVLWIVKPTQEVSPRFLAFTPDNRHIYAGGLAGILYTMDVRTGQILSQREDKNPHGNTSLYCREIAAVSASPDGRFIAIGTAPDGLVLLYSIRDGQSYLLRHVPVEHEARIEVLSFSPDSKRLASCGEEEIKIWRLPEEPATPQPDKAATN